MQNYRSLNNTQSWLPDTFFSEFGYTAGRDHFAMFMKCMCAHILLDEKNCKSKLHKNSNKVCCLHFPKFCYIKYANFELVL